MRISKVAVCLAALVWTLGFAPLTAATAFVAAVCAVLELAALRAGQPATVAVVPSQPAGRPTAVEVGSSFPVARDFSSANAAAPSAVQAEQLLARLESDFTFTDMGSESSASTVPRAVGQEPSQGEPVAVRHVAIAPGMLEVNPAVEAPTPQDLPRSDAHPSQAWESDKPVFTGGDEASGRSLAACRSFAVAESMMDDGFRSEPPGGY